MLVIMKSQNVGRCFYSVKPRALETQINPLCDDPVRQFTSFVALSRCSWSPGNHKTFVNKHCIKMQHLLKLGANA